MTTPLAVFWFRRDLRLDDNAGLSHALASGRPVLPIFIFDPAILAGLPRNDARVTFIYDTLQALRAGLEAKYASSIALYHGKPLDVFAHILRSHPVAAVYTNHDYEPYARERDEAVRQWLEAQRVAFRTYKDHVLFEKDEISKDGGGAYTVYTPYMRKWRKVHSQTPLTPYATTAKLTNLVKQTALPDVSLADIGFTRSAMTIPTYRLEDDILQYYARDRDFPSLAATSLLGPHLRFGTVSIRQIFQRAFPRSDTFCNELIWREFFSQILWHFPHTPQRSFKPQYDRIQWRNDETEFKRWCEGTTGYPLVDAGMRQLNATGTMHNRVRMITASFLCKHLLIDWRWGEAYFAQKLFDYEMASNVGNWQWVAGCGVDAAPYFRIFNPSAQTEKFDKQFAYIQTWVSDWHTLTYPAPIVDHTFARERCLQAYQQAVG
ncbi:MAG: DNA photolyase family protein [Nitrosomonas sp.]|uniref:cryptochrome/photolyase family protein n=1 Tax=Nitrosomonas sp. TaxID=42353 RepID=UPI0025CD1473|nr:deoxyribodipyrimidine photo-lyase [Nitrosomonas sp.]UJP02999.1 MAG: DNA photolyase family protein [Nitrosomonas sp.]